MLALHVLSPTDRISPVRSTLSQYALGPSKWIFDVAVLLVAIGSALAFAALVRQGVIRAVSGCAVLGAVWTLSLLVIVWFTKTDWTVGPSMGGTIHRYASVVGFVSLPLAVIVLAPRAFAGSAGWRLAAQGFGVLSLASFSLIVIGVVRMAGGGGPWWRFVPLGLVERTIAVAAVAALTVVVLGVLVRAKSPAVVARSG